MIKAVVFVCLVTAYVSVAFGLSTFLGAFIRYHENA